MIGDGAGNPMTIQRAVIERLKRLPLQKQREVLDFVEFLRGKGNGRRPRKSLKGLCADLGVDLTEEALRQARCEMWGAFPRDP